MCLASDPLLTSLVIAELHGLVQFELISIHLCIKAIEWLQHDREVSGACVH